MVMYCQISERATITRYVFTYHDCVAFTFNKYFDQLTSRPPGCIESVHGSGPGVRDARDEVMHGGA